METKKLMTLSLKASGILLAFGIILLIVGVVLTLTHPQETEPTDLELLLPIIAFLAIIISLLVFIIFVLISICHALEHSRYMWAIGMFLIIPLSLLYYYLYVIKEEKNS